MGNAKRHYTELRRRFSRIAAVRMFGMKAGKLGPGRATLTLDTGPRHSHPQGVHGGVLAALAAPALAMSISPRPRAGTCISPVEMKINSLAPPRGGRLRADARVLRQG